MQNTQEQQTTILPHKLFARRGVKPETLLQHITLQTNTNDIGDVNYTQGGTNNHQLQPLSDTFCDNCIIYYDIPKPTQACKDLDKYIARHLPEHTARIVRVLDTLGITVSKYCVKPTRAIQQPQCIRQYCKIALQDIPYNTSIRLCTDATVMQTLSDNGLYVHDIDFTRDYAGVIDKAEVIHYLLQDTNYSK